MSDGGGLEEQQVQLIAEHNRTHAWACTIRGACALGRIGWGPSNAYTYTIAVLQTISLKFFYMQSYQ